MSRTRPAEFPAQSGTAQAQHGEGSVAAPVRRHVEPSDLRVEKIVDGGREAIRGLRIALHELVPVDDLEHALGAGAVGDIDAIPERDRARGAPSGAVPDCARLLAGQSEVADEARLSRIAEVVDLRHPVGPPARRAAIRDEVGDARVALPPVLVRADRAPAPPSVSELRLLRRAHVPHLVGEIAEGAQEIGLGGIALGQRLAVADADHGGAARLGLPRPRRGCDGDRRGRLGFVTSTIDVPFCSICPVSGLSRRPP